MSRPLPPASSPPARWQSCLTCSVILSLLVGAGGLVIGAMWVGLQLMVNPNALAWVNRYLPEWTQIPIEETTPPQSLSEIQAAIAQTGYSAGAAIPLVEAGASPDDPTDILVPVLERLNPCEANTCDRIVELQHYQPAQGRSPVDVFHLIQRVSITGMEQSAIVAPLARAGLDVASSSRSLPFSQLELFRGGPTPGVWLTLYGTWSQGDQSVRYGQIVRFNPRQGYLRALTPWVSPTNELPTWQEITAGGAPELVINQSVGLEPAFQVYQVQPIPFTPDPVDLVALTLSPSAIADPTFENALTLARSGLWSPAQASLDRLRKNQALWTPGAEAQYDLIRLHAGVTQAQANQAWASPSQQILAQLIDGRWEAALKTLESTQPHRTEIVSLLKSDRGRLENRLDSALRVYPGNTKLLVWGTLLRGSKTNAADGLAWLNKQLKVSADARSQAVAMLRLTDAAILATEPGASHFSQIIGSAEALPGITPSAWLRPDGEALELPAGQRWYQIEVTRFHDGRDWQRSPFASLGAPTQPAARLWKRLGLDTDNQIQLLQWTPDGQQQSVITVVKALRTTGDRLWLLAAGEPSSPSTDGSSSRAFALSATALQWLAPSATSLIGYAQQQPDAATPLVSNLWQVLRQAGYLTEVQAPRPEDLPLVIQELPIQQIDLTADGKPELLVTLYADSLAQLQPAKPRPKGAFQSLLFDASGKLLYSELSQPSQTLLAIATLSSGEPAILLSDANTYRLQQWSPQRQAFESTP